MEDQLISIIIPVYQVEQYLNRCLTSVVSQTYRNLEIILIDDGSTDQSPRMCDEWAKKDSRIIVRHQRNMGAGAARNVGLSLATGDLIGFVDSDDWIDSEMYTVLSQMLKKFPQAEMAMCGTVWTSSKEQRVTSQDIVLLTREEMLRHFFREHGGKSDFGIYTKLIRRSVLKGFSFKEGTISEDVMASYYFNMHCTSIALTPCQLYFYFDNRSGVTKSQVSQKDLEYIHAFKWISDDIAVHYPTLSQLALSNYYRANFTILSKMKLFGYDKKDTNLCTQYRALKKFVRRHFFNLIGMKMPFSRKILLIYDCI